MIISVLLAYFKKNNRERAARALLAGVFAAIGTAIVGGAILYATVRTYAGTRLQTEIETYLYLIAVVVLTYMTFWMTKHGKDIPGQLKSKADTAFEHHSGDDSGSVAFFMIAYQAVLRESLEAMVFTMAIVFANGAVMASIGALAGVAAALVVARLIYSLGHRVNLARAFRILGLSLTFFSAALLIDAIENLQSLGWINVLRTPLWNTSHVISENSGFGDALHSLLGYAAAPTPLQVMGWILYMGVIAGAFLVITKRRVRPAGSVASSA